jgi:hypothetical protein
MMNRSTLRLAATAIAIACVAAADAQQADAERVDAPAFAAPADSQRSVIEGRAYRPSDPAATTEQSVEPLRPAQAAPAEPPAQPARLPDMAALTPLLVFLGVLALVGALLLMTSRRFGRMPWESDETEASTARGRQKRLAVELRALWDKTTTTERLRLRDEPKTGHAVSK